MLEAILIIIMAPIALFTLLFWAAIILGALGGIVIFTKNKISKKH